MNCECGEVFGEECTWSGREKDMFLVEVNRNNILAKVKYCGNFQRIKVSRYCAELLVRHNDGILVIQFENWPSGIASNSLFLGEMKISNYEAVFRDFHTFISNKDRSLEFSKFINRVMTNLFNNFKMLN